MEISDLTIRVRPTCNVLNMVCGELYEVYPSPRIEKLIGTGHLVWIDEPDDWECRGGIE